MAKTIRHVNSIILKETTDNQNMVCAETTYFEKPDENDNIGKITINIDMPNGDYYHVTIPFKSSDQLNLVSTIATMIIEYGNQNIANDVFGLVTRINDVVNAIKGGYAAVSNVHDIKLYSKSIAMEIHTISRFVEIMKDILPKNEFDIVKKDILDAFAEFIAEKYISDTCDCENCSCCSDTQESTLENMTMFTNNLAEKFPDDIMMTFSDYNNILTTDSMRNIRKAAEEFVSIVQNEITRYNKPECNHDSKPKEEENLKVPNPSADINENKESDAKIHECNCAYDDSIGDCSCKCDCSDESSNPEYITWDEMKRLIGRIDRIDTRVDILFDRINALTIELTNSSDNPVNDEIQEAFVDILKLFKKILKKESKRIK